MATRKNWWPCFLHQLLPTLIKCLSPSTFTLPLPLSCTLWASSAFLHQDYMFWPFSIILFSFGLSNLSRLTCPKVLTVVRKRSTGGKQKKVNTSSVSYKIFGFFDKSKAILLFFPAPVSCTDSDESRIFRNLF